MINVSLIENLGRGLKIEVMTRIHPNSKTMSLSQRQSGQNITRSKQKADQDLQNRVLKLSKIILRIIKKDINHL